MENQRDIPGFRGLRTTGGIIGLVLTLLFGAGLVKIATVIFSGGDISYGGGVTRPWRGIGAFLIFFVIGVVLIRDAWLGQSDRPKPPKYSERLERSRARKWKRRERRRHRT